ncbi:hypothetical protein RSAG8_10001, partial [Rhizoctonia solani AG-8 WAC10335]
MPHVFSALVPPLASLGFHLVPYRYPSPRTQRLFLALSKFIPCSQWRQVMRRRHGAAVYRHAGMGGSWLATETAGFLPQGWIISFARGWPRKALLQGWPRSLHIDERVDRTANAPTSSYILARRHMERPYPAPWQKSTQYSVPIHERKRRIAPLWYDRL